MTGVVKKDGEKERLKTKVLFKKATTAKKCNMVPAMTRKSSHRDARRWTWGADLKENAFQIRKKLPFAKSVDLERNLIHCLTKHQSIND